MEQPTNSTTPTPGAKPYSPKSHTPEAETFVIDSAAAPRVAGGNCTDHRPMPDGTDHGFVAMICPNCHRGYLERVS